MARELPGKEACHVVGRYRCSSTDVVGVYLEQQRQARQGDEGAGALGGGRQAAGGVPFPPTGGLLRGFLRLGGTLRPSPRNRPDRGRGDGLY